MFTCLCVFVREERGSVYMLVCVRAGGDGKRLLDCVCVRAGGEGECLHARVCSCRRRVGAFTCSCVFVQEERGSVYMLVCVRAGGEGERLHACVFVREERKSRHAW